MKLSFAERVALFWSHVQKSDGCWEWQGRRTSRGYGRTTGRLLGGPRTARAHRVAWELTNGPIPGGLGVLHRCDNPPCCNPDHLFLGTAADNAADMVAKGRAHHPKGKGEQSPAARLTTAQVMFMRTLRSRGASILQLEALFGVSNQQVSKITSGKSWGHLPITLGAPTDG